jgi:hypothetical protein
MAWLRLQQNDAALVTVWSAPDNLGLKRKFLFSYFCENFAKIFFRFLQKSSLKAAKMFVFAILFLAEGIENKMIPKTWAKTKICTKTFAKTKTFCEIFR